MIHFYAKHQKSEAKRKVKQAKIKRKNRSETKIKRKKAKKSKKFAQLPPPHSATQCTPKVYTGQKFRKKMASIYSDITTENSFSRHK
jgi:hypothetical protein